MSKLSQNEIDALFAKYTNPPADAPPPLPPAGPEPEAEEVPAPVAAPAPAYAPTPAPAYAPTPAPAPAAAAGAAARPVTFPTLAPAPAVQGEPTPMSILADVELEVTVRLGRTRRSIRDVLALGSGAVLELDSPAGEAVDVLVNGRLVARGEVVVVGENYGVRVTELVRAPGERPS